MTFPPSPRIQPTVFDGTTSLVTKSPSSEGALTLLWSKISASITGDTGSPGIWIQKNRDKTVRTHNDDWYDKRMAIRTTIYILPP
jgi:hypothetical protein